MIKTRTTQLEIKQAMKTYHKRYGVKPGPDLKKDAVKLLIVISSAIFIAGCLIVIFKPGL